MASIPLECICCPRKPKFSDSSHLLTHIASKGHLSHYYKLKVRSGSDQAARQTVDAFDQWYSDWNVEELMHERFNHKDKKRPRPRAAGSSRISSRAGTPRANGLATTRAASVDPRFRIKTEARSTPSLSTAPSPHIYHFPQHIGLTPPGFGWQPNGNFPVLPNQHKIITDWMGDNQSDGSSLTSLPATESIESAVGTDETADTYDPTEVADCSKLKGVFWPGMDIFDSATPEQKKKRNQKKDSSVLVRLERDSTVVEATENVWSPLGQLKKCLPITGNPEEDDEDECMLSSPLKPLKTSPKKTTGRRETRSALAELDSEQSKTPRRVTRSTYGQLSARDERLETQLTYGGGQKRKRFPIFEDDDDDASSHHGPTIHSHPPALNLLTQTFPTSNHLSHSQFGFGSGSGNRYHGQGFLEKENVTAPFSRNVDGQHGYCDTTTPFTMAQYSLPQHASTFHYNSAYNTTWNNHEASMFAHPSQSIHDHDALKLSPIKIDGQVADDDERTITAPPSEV